MRVVCENCGASYKIPETKLVKEVNKATCRKCGHRMLIRKAGEADGATQQMDENPFLSSAGSEEFRAAIAAATAGVPRVDIAPRSEWEEEDPTHIAQLDEYGEPIPPPPPPLAARQPAMAGTADRSRPAPAVPAPAPVIPAPVAPPPPMAAPVMPTPAVTVAPAPTPAPRPAAPVVPAVSIHSPSPAPAVPVAPLPAPSPAVASVVPQAAGPQPAAAAAFDPSGDLGLVGFAVVVAAFGALLLAVNEGGGFIVRLLALFLTLWGTLTSLFVVVTGSRGRRKASVILSTILGTMFAAVGAGAVVGAVSGANALSSFSGELAAATATPAPEAEAPAAPLGTLFADEPVAEAAPAEAAPPTEPEAVAEAAPPVEAAPPAQPPPVPAPAPTPTASAKAKEPEVDRASAYVAPPSEPARTTSTSGSSSAKTTSSSATSSSGTSSSSKSGSTASAPAAEAPKSAMSSLPPTVVDTMVKSNQSVKKCMYQEFKRSDGNLGSVKVRFKVLSSGKVSSASMLSSNYKGTELDTCMTAALYTVVFPSFDGEAQSFDITLGT